MYAHVPPEKFVLHMVFHSQWEAGAVELCFEGVRRFHIVGLEDNYMKDIYDAYLAFRENLLPTGHGAGSRVIIWADWADFVPIRFKPADDDSLGDPEIDEEAMNGDD